MKRKRKCLLLTVILFIASCSKETMVSTRIPVETAENFLDNIQSTEQVVKTEDSQSDFPIEPTQYSNPYTENYPIEFSIYEIDNGFLSEEDNYLITWDFYIGTINDVKAFLEYTDISFTENNRNVEEIEFSINGVVIENDAQIEMLNDYGYYYLKWNVNYASKEPGNYLYNLILSWQEDFTINESDFGPSSEIDSWNFELEIIIESEQQTNNYLNTCKDNIKLPVNKEWVVLLCENFNDNRYRWYLGEFDDKFARGKIEIKNGRYEQLYKTKSGFLLDFVFHPVDIGILWKDFMMSFEFSINTLYKRDVKIGIALRPKYPFPVEYLIVLNSMGEYEFLSRNFETNQDIILKTKKIPIIDYQEKNQIVLQYEEHEDEDSTYFVYLNGKLIDTFHLRAVINNNPFRINSMGPIVVMEKGTQAIYYFDDFLLTAPEKTHFWRFTQ